MSSGFFPFLATNKEGMQSRGKSSTEVRRPTGYQATPWKNKECFLFFFSFLFQLKHSTIFSTGWASAQSAISLLSLHSEDCFFSLFIARTYGGSFGQKQKKPEKKKESKIITFLCCIFAYFILIIEWGINIRVGFSSVRSWRGIHILSRLVHSPSFRG